jgi:hypothetical protein
MPIELVFTENIAPALGMSYGRRIRVDTRTGLLETQISSTVSALVVGLEIAFRDSPVSLPGNGLGLA